MKSFANNFNHELNEYFVQILISVKKVICKRCNERFLFKNKLHAHIRQCKIKFKKSIVIKIYHENFEVIVSDVSSKQFEDLKFRF